MISGFLLPLNLHAKSSRRELNRALSWEWAAVAVVGHGPSISPGILGWPLLAGHSFLQGLGQCVFVVDQMPQEAPLEGGWLAGWSCAFTVSSASCRVG